MEIPKRLCAHVTRSSLGSIFTLKHLRGAISRLHSEMTPAVNQHNHFLFYLGVGVSLWEIKQSLHTHNVQSY